VLREQRRVQRAERRVARGEFRAAVRANGKLIAYHAGRIAIAETKAVGMGLFGGLGGAYLGVMRGLMFDQQPGPLGRAVSAVFGTAGLVSSYVLFHSLYTDEAREKTVQRGVANGSITRDQGMRWEKMHLISREWRQQYAFDGLPILEKDQLQPNQDKDQR
jgi:hypothetical protein